VRYDGRIRGGASGARRRRGGAGGARRRAGETAARDGGEVERAGETAARDGGEVERAGEGSEATCGIDICSDNAGVVWSFSA
jgi:hypothetical protein